MFFSGMEFSLPFMTYDLFGYNSKKNGRMLGFIGLVASLLQGTLTRRLHPLKVVKVGVIACALSFLILGRVSTEGMLYAAAALLAVTSATVVTGLNSLSSFEAGENERGGKLGNHRSFGKQCFHTFKLQLLIQHVGQIGRAIGPLLFCTLYWWAGREVAYGIGGAGMLGVTALVFATLRVPPGTEKVAIRQHKADTK
jgi:hypothetical protein